MIRRTVVAGLALALLLGGSGTALGRDAEDLSVSADDPVHEHQYPPIPANNPNTLLHTPSDCRTALYCDVIDVVVEVPDSYTERDLYEVVITLSWQDAADDADLDMYLYDEDETRITESASGTPGEQAGLPEPSEGTYFVVVNNWAGTHQSYTLKAEFKYNGKRAPVPDLELPTAPPEPTPPPAEPTPQPTPEPTPAATPDAGPQLAPVTTPGSDGPLREVALSSVPGSGQPLDEGGGWGWVLPVSVVAGIVGLGGAAYVVRRRRLDDVA